MNNNDGRPGGLPMNEACEQSSPTVGIPDADDYDDWHDEGCYECGGEGFISDCVEEWACVDPEYGCDYCTRRCPLCNPAKPNLELQQVLSDALAQGIEAGTVETERLDAQHESPVACDAPNACSEGTSHAD